MELSEERELWKPEMTILKDIKINFKKAFRAYLPVLTSLILKIRRTNNQNKNGGLYYVG